MTTKEKLIKLNRIQNHIQLMKQLNKLYGFNTINKDKLEGLKEDVDTLYKSIKGEKVSNNKRNSMVETALRTLYKIFKDITLK